MIPIPKIIHYCWFGRKPLPELAQRCIASWRKYLPNYEIKEWNEDNFDVFIIPYTAEAYKAQKYAFVSDFARFWILFHYGGIYFDTDVEVIKSLDDIVERGPFMGYEDEKGLLNISNHYVNPGLGMGIPPGYNLLKEILEYYQYRHLFTWDGKIVETIVYNTTKILQNKIVSKGEEGYDIIEGVNVYYEDYFCPHNYYTGELNITPNTRSIHHYNASWVKENRTIWSKIKKRIRMIYYHCWGELFVLFHKHKEVC